MDPAQRPMNELETCSNDNSNLPALPSAPARVPLVPERSDFLEGDAPAAARVEAFLARALEATGGDAPTTAGALVPWICDALLSNHSVKAYGRDLMDFLRHMQAQGVTPLKVTADHVKLYKRALLEAGRTSATVARRLSVLRGTYKRLAAKGLISWETAQDIGAVKAPGVQKNSTSSLTQKQAIALLEAIPSDTLQGIRDLAMMSIFFITGCRVLIPITASAAVLIIWKAALRTSCSRSSSFRIAAEFVYFFVLFKREPELALIRRAGWSLGGTSGPRVTDS